MEIMKVSSTSVPNHVAGAIASLMREKEKIIIQTIGAAALNQAIKAVAIARGFLAPSGKNLAVVPAFNDVLIAGEEKTAIRLILETL